MASLIVRCSLVLAAFFSISGSAFGLEFLIKKSSSQTVLELSGTFKKGDSDNLLPLLSSNIIDEVHLTSGGGNFFEGLLIGKLLRKNNLTTRIKTGEKCASACAYAFLGGRFRYIDGREAFGVHMSSLADNEEFRGKILEIIEIGTEDSTVFAIATIERTAAIAASSAAKYLVDMGVSLRLMTPVVDTDMWDMHWLAPSELRSYNVINTD